MPSTLRICLKSGDRIFVNGAVLRADRKVTLEILNEVTFLLEHHFIGEQEATTPLRRLYFLVQSMLTEPHTAQATRNAVADALAQLLAGEDCAGDYGTRLVAIAELIERERSFEALKLIRSLFPVEHRSAEVA